MELVDIDADLFTAHNHQLNAVDAEMKRLSALAQQPPRPACAVSPPPNDHRTRIRLRDTINSL